MIYIETFWVFQKCITLASNKQIWSQGLEVIQPNGQLEAHLSYFKKIAVYVTNIVKLFLEHILEPAKEAQLNRRRCVGEFGLDGAAHYTQFYHISESKHFLEI